MDPFTIALIIGAVISVGTVIYQTQQVKKRTKKQEAAAKAQAEAAGQQRAIAGAPISATQMKMVMGQRQIENLVQKFYEQDRTEPEIYTLPTAEPTSPVERFNRALEDLFRK